MNKTWGALPKEWDLFVGLGLTEDLLPTVCNPGAKIDPKSKMKKVGKTPSVYNASGLVAGFGKWTEKTASDGQIRNWKREPDYGVCIQTRLVRALDIDVPNQDQADAIRHYIQTQLTGFAGVIAPVRYRKDSGKCLVGVIVHGEFGKRTVRVEGGIIEFLANGQQFVAAGVHQSGSRYKWNWNGEPEFPVISLKKANKLWARIVKKFGIEEASEGGIRKARDKNELILPDETADYLEAESLVLSLGQDGQLFIDCPFKDQHSDESVESATAYFPKGTRGYQRGHFKCLHAHCAKRTDMEFLDALGKIKAEFEPIKLTKKEKKAAARLDGLARDKAGKIESIIPNLDKALRRANMAGVQIGYDDFLADEMLQKVGKDGAVKAWRSFEDNDYTKIQIKFEETGFKPIGFETLRRAVKNVAREQTFDSAQIWISNLPKWDGKKRAEHFLPRYIGTRDTDYKRAVGLYIWSALAGRVIQPGVKADMAPIFFGEQGTGKSTAIKTIAAMPGTFAEISFDEKDDDFARKLRGVIVGELAELRGLNTRDNEYIKATIARTHEKWVKKYEERTTSFPRRCVLMASTNIRQLLADDTGERRWLPFECATVQPIDNEGLARDVLQLWAEGAALFMSHGVMWQDAERLANKEHGKYKISDDRIELIRDWLDENDMDGGRPADKEHLFSHEILIGALHYKPKEIQRRDEMALSSMMMKLRYVKHRIRLEGQQKWVFARR